MLMSAEAMNALNHLSPFGPGSAIANPNGGISPHALQIFVYLDYRNEGSVSVKLHLTLGTTHAQASMLLKPGQHSMKKPSYLVLLECGVWRYPHG